ncbi:MAG: PilN domain-containing protein [Desulfuromonadales bacterium]|nr:PilN domain-containing protein [Desulfuromonadales bacterium]
MIRINLLPVKAAQKKEMLKGQLMVVILALIVTAGLCGAAYTYIAGEVEARQERIDQKKAEISQLMKKIGEVNQFKKRQEALRAKLDVLDQLKAARVGPVYILDALYRALPDKLWLTKLQLGSNQANISGIGVNEETVALFMKNLEASDFFEGVELKVTKQIVQDNIKFQQFDLSCRTKNTKSD